MSAEQTREELLAGLHLYQNKVLAEHLLVTVALAVEYFPQEMRHALGQVFDLAAVEAATERMAQVLNHAQQRADETRYLLQQVSADLDDIEKRIDALTYTMEKCHQ